VVLSKEFQFHPNFSLFFIYKDLTVFNLAFYISSISKESSPFEFTRCVVIISNFTLYNGIYFHFKYEELKTTIINRNFKAVVSNKMIRHDMLK
jgi:hypothetical protein